MKNTKVTLAPLEAGDREQFILDNQKSFKYGAVEEFGLRDDHFDEDGEIISRATMFRSSLNSIRQKQKNAAPPFPVRHRLCTLFHHFSFLPPRFFRRSSSMVKPLIMCICRSAGAFSRLWRMADGC